MLSRNLLRSFRASELAKNFLYVWGYNDIYFRDTGSDSVFDTVLSSPVLVDSTKKYSVLPDEGDFGAVISSKSDLYSFGSFEESLPNTIVKWSQLPKYSAVGVARVAISLDGSLYVWGNNNAGQLGLNKDSSELPSSRFPIKFDTNSWSQISVDSNFVAAIRADGALFTWGNNLSGQLGQDDRINRSSPVQVGTSSWSQVSVSGSGVAAIRADGSLFVWGNNNVGQLGINSLISRSSPVQVGTSSWTQVTHTTNTTYAIRVDNRLFTWGSNFSGQLGLNDRINRSSPVQVGSAQWKFVDSSGTTVAAIRFDDTLFTWGDNTFGRLGLNDLIPRSSPVQVGTSSWSTVGVGFSHVAAIRLDGSLFTWGAGTFLGRGISEVNRSSPVQVGTDTSWTQTAIVEQSFSPATYVLTSDNKIFGFGRHGIFFGGTIPRYDNIQLNEPEELVYADPSIRPIFNNKVSKITTARPDETLSTLLSAKIVPGPGGGAVISELSFLYTWGKNDVGQIGISPPSQFVSTPTLVSQSKFTNVSIDQNSSPASFQIMAVAQDGSLFGAGTNDFGQLGLNNNPSRITSVIGFQKISNDSWIQVSTRNARSIGIKSDNLLYGWGDKESLSTFPFYVPMAPVTTYVPNNNYSWRQITLALASSAAIRSDGALFTWGDNQSGQLGLNDRVQRSFPVQVGTSRWTRVTGGGRFNAGGGGGPTFLAIRQDGTLWSWGGNNIGMLGINGFTTINDNRSSPVQVGTESWKFVAAGDESVAAVRSVLNIDRLFTWGENGFGQLGHLDTIGRSSPTQVTTLPAFASNVLFREVAVGSNHMLLRTGISPNVTTSLLGWGNNNFGQLGVNDTVSRSSSVFIASGALPTWSSDDIELRPIISAAGNTSAYITSGSGLFTFGENTSGELGLNNTIHRSSPVQVGLSLWSQVSVGNRSMTALSSNRFLFTWGNNQSAQLGLNDRINRSSPVQVGTSSWQFLPSNNSSSGGSIRNAAILGLFFGDLYSWGQNGFAALGIGVGATAAARSSPVLVDSATIEFVSDEPQQIGNKTWSQAYMGRSHVVAIDTDGYLYTWGKNEKGQLGLGATSTEGFSEPTLVGVKSWVQIASSAESIAAINSDGSLFTWGRNDNGQLGQNDTLWRSSPVQVGTIFDGNKWKKVAVGKSHMAAISSNGDLFIWGNNLSGQLGLNDQINRSSPVQLPGLNVWKDVDASESTYAIRTDGGLFTWGLNSNGQLGISTLITRSSPVQVGTSSWAQVSAGPLHVAAIDSEKRLFSWGQNNVGQLGHNNIINRSSPVQVGITSWQWFQVSTGGTATLAIRDDKLLYAWGQNFAGQLGINNTINRSSPMQVGTSQWKQVSIANSTSTSIREDGTLFTWGNNFDGQLGLNDRIARSSPVQVGSNKWKFVTAQSSLNGQNKVLAIPEKSDEIANVIYTLYGFGSNFSGVLGVGDTISRSSPVQVGGFEKSNVPRFGKFTVGDALTLGLGVESESSENVLYGFGDNSVNQLLTPIISDPGVPATQIDSSSTHGFYIGNDGRLFAFGNNFLGRLGTFTEVDGDVGPLGEQVEYFSWTQISTGDNSSSAAIRSDGRLFTWGLNSSGQLGLNDTINRSRPTQVGTLSWTQVSVAQFHMAALRAGIQNLWAWGSGTFGKLGASDAITRSSPVQVSTLDTFTQVSAGTVHTAAIRNDGRLFTWGRNAAFGVPPSIPPAQISPGGALGTGDFIDRSFPVQVGTSSWSQVSTGERTTFAITSTGDLFGWGGQVATLGQFPTVTRNSPGFIGSGFSKVFARRSHTVAIDTNNNLVGFGRNFGGLLGGKNTAGTLLPTDIVILPEVLNDSKSWISASVSFSATRLLDSDGVRYTMTSNGPIVLGPEVTRFIPSIVTFPDEYTDVLASGNTVYALKKTL
jgi:alpha-tubulin suppressor-like RCC1 family protein